MTDRDKASIAGIGLLIGMMLAAGGIIISSQPVVSTESEQAAPVDDWETVSMGLPETDNNFQATRIDVLCLDGHKLAVVRTRGNTTPVAVARLGGC